MHAVWGSIARVAERGIGVAHKGRSRFMQKSNEEWWECTNRMCGHKIQFVALGIGPNRANPTCFCGSSMKRPYLKPHYSEYMPVSVADPGTGHGAKAVDVSLQLFVVPLAMNCLSRRSDAS